MWYQTLQDDLKKKERHGLKVREMNLSPVHTQPFNERNPSSNRKSVKAQTESFKLCPEVKQEKVM